jgi:hypothetical protein
MSAVLPGTWSGRPGRVNPNNFATSPSVLYCHVELKNRINVENMQPLYDNCDGFVRYKTKFKKNRGFD